MENAHTSGLQGGNLNLAVDRLDRALAALEARVRALQAGEALPVAAGRDDYGHVLSELEEARLSNAQLAAAAGEAHAVLGAAAANIRHLISNEEAA